MNLKLFLKDLKSTDWSLVYLLARSKILANHYESLLGIFWSLVFPVVSALVLVLAFQSRLRVKSSDYFLYVLLGFVLVNFFISSTSKMLSLLQSQREMFLFSTVSKLEVILNVFLVSSFKFSIEFSLCVLIGLFRGQASLSGMLLLLLVLLLFLLFTLCCGFILAMFHSFLRDTRYLWSLLARLLLFVSPVFYHLTELSIWGRLLIGYGNPLSQFLAVMRGVLIESEAVTSFGVLYILLVTISTAAISLYFYGKWFTRALERV